MYAYVHSQRQAQTREAQRLVHTSLGPSSLRVSWPLSRFQMCMACSPFSAVAPTVTTSEVGNVALEGET